MKSRLKQKLAAVVAAGAMLASVGFVPAQTPAVGAAQPTSTVVAQTSTLKTVNYLAKANRTVRMMSSRSRSATLIRTFSTNYTLRVDREYGSWVRARGGGKVGWIAKAHLTRTTATTATTSTSPITTVSYRASVNRNTSMYTSRSTSSTKAQTMFRGTVAQVTGAYGSWLRVRHNGKTGWMPSGHLTRTSAALNNPGVTGGKEVKISGAYTSNRAGLTDRYWSKSAIRLYTVAGRKVRITDIPANSVMYRDIVNERRGGSLPGWYFVRTQGTWGWVQAHMLQRTSTAATSNSRGINAAQVKRQTNGRIPNSMLVAVPWDPEKTLIAAPALADLTRLNNAFKKRFGHNIDIDLIYRTRGTQDHLYRELGPYIAAVPGTSIHGYGMAIDVPEWTKYNFESARFKWLKANSHKYNWVHPKRLEKGSPYAEYWHFEYVGR